MHAQVLAGRPRPLQLQQTRVPAARGPAPAPRRIRRAHRRCLRMPKAKPADDDDDEAPSTSYNQLEATIKRKQVQVEAALQELGMEGLEERLQSATQSPARPEYRLLRKVQEVTQFEGRAALVVEVTRPSPATTPEQLAALARSYLAMGADALVVRTDAADTPEGLKDLFAVVQAARGAPVIARDWYIHPLQIVEAKEAGAAGVLGVIGQVNGRGTVLMSSFAAAIGLDAPVEVVNLREVEGMQRTPTGPVFFAINVGVGLSIAVPGFASDVAHGLLGELPFGTFSLVGVKGVEEARKARASGADAILIKGELITAAAAQGVDARTLIDQIRYVTCGDD